MGVITILSFRFHNNPRLTTVSSLAELTTGILCVSLPELGPLLRKKRLHGPTDSIAQGKYRSENTVYRGPGSGGFSATVSHRMRKLDSLEPYVELDESDLLGSHALPELSHTRDKDQVRREVAVTREFRVDSSSANVV